MLSSNPYIRRRSTMDTTIEGYDHYMHLYTMLIVALISSLSHALPCVTLIERSPWHVSWLMVRNALPSSPTGSSIHFHVDDTNAGLELDTSCRGTTPVGTGLKPEDAQHWVPCEDERISFFHEPGRLQLKRTYIDDWYVSLLCLP